MKPKRVMAFTLVELMVVVAIIAILAILAVVNFQNASIRSRVSRAKSDLASIQTALEAYAVDQGSYPLNAGGLGLPGALMNLVAPRAYLTAIPEDAFRAGQIYFYIAGGSATGVQRPKFGEYALASAGPDGRIETSLTSAIVYDPTNGTASRGDIVFTHRTRDEAGVTAATENS